MALALDTTHSSTTRTDWAALMHELGPRFAARCAEHDSADTFVADNYRELKAGLQADGEVFETQSDTEVLLRLLVRRGPGALDYRRQVNADGSPSELVSAGYRWAPGSELKLKVA